MWLLMILALSFVGNSVYGQTNTGISLMDLAINPGTVTLDMPDMTLVPEGMGGGGGNGLPSSLAIRCRDGFNTMLETVAGTTLGILASSNQKNWINRSYDYANNKLMYDFQTTDRAMSVCETSPEVCGIVSSITPRGDQYVAGMVAMQGSNNYMSPYGSSYGITSESMMRNAAYSNPFMYGGYDNYGGTTTSSNYGRGTLS